MPQRQALHQAIRVASDPLEVLDRIVRQALALLPQADGASLEVLRDAQTLEYLTAAGTLAPHVGLRLPLRGSFSGLAVLTGSVQICMDAQNDPRVNAAAVKATGVASMLCVPLSDQPSGIAVLKVSSGSVNAFSQDDVVRLEMLARFLSATVQAASELASVIADVLAALDRIDDPNSMGLDWQQATARFVANVMTPGLADQVETKSQIEAIICNEAIDILFQPVVNLTTDEIVACEALSRFRGYPGTSPDYWFAAAQRAGLGAELELLAIRRALDQMRELPSHLRVAINAAPQTILHPEFSQLIESSSIIRLTIELTEHDAVSSYTDLLAVLLPLRDQGARLSVDDTGSGYAGLNQILQIKPDIIKLDREMVLGISGDPVRRALATALVAFANAIDSHIIAEGLETQQDVDCVRGLGIAEVQGYYYYRPLKAEQLRAIAGTHQ